MKNDARHLDEKLDRMLKQAIQPPENLVESIQNAVRTYSREQISTFHWWHDKKIRSAVIASVAVFIAVLTVTAHWFRRAPVQTTVVQSTSPHAQPPLHANNDVSLEVSVSQNLTLTSANTSIPRASTAALRRHAIHDTVVHTWYANDVTKAREILKTFVRQNNIVPQFTGDGNSVTIKLSDRQLQQLVNALEAVPAKLFDQQLPRPNEEDKVEFNGKNVIYRCMFVNI